MSNQSFNWNEIDNLRSSVDLDFDTYIDLPSLVEPRETTATLTTYLETRPQTDVCPLQSICNDVFEESFPDIQHTSTNETVINDSVIGNPSLVQTGSFAEFPITLSLATTVPQYSINPTKTLIKKPKTARRLFGSPSPAFRFARPITPSVSSRSTSPPSSICGSDATTKPVTTTTTSTDDPDPFNSTINITSLEVSKKALSYLHPNIKREYEEKLIELEYTLRTEYNEKNEIELHRVREACRVEFEAVLEQRMWELEKNYENQLDEMRAEFEATLKERMEEVQAICNETVEEKEKQLERLKKKLQRGTDRNTIRKRTDNRKAPLTRTRLRPWDKNQSKEDEAWRSEVIRVERPVRKTQVQREVVSTLREKSVVPSIIEISSDDSDEDAHAKHLSDGEIDETPDNPPAHEGEDNAVNTESLSEGEIDETSSNFPVTPPDQEVKLNEAQTKFFFNLQLEYALERARLLDALEEIRACREKIIALERERQQRDEIENESWDDL